MSFAAPAFLPLLLLTSIPLLIHIFSRVRLQRREFPSLRLLEAVRRERFSFIRLKELLLLILRTLALLALVLIPARPFLHRRAGLLPESDFVVILDDSWSMGWGSRWERAITIARHLLATAGPGRRAALLTASGRWSDSTLSERPPASRRLDSLAVSTAAVILDSSIARAWRIGGDRVTVYCITDLQQQALRTLRPAADRPVRLIDVGDDDAANVTVVSVQPDIRLPPPGRSVRIKAEFANHADRQLTGTALLDVNGRIEQRSIELPPRATTVCNFSLDLAGPATHTARVQFRSDSLALDNDRWSIINLPAQRRLLLVETDSGSGRFITAALGSESLGWFDISTISPAQLGRFDLRRYDCILVTDAGGLSPAAFDRIQLALQAGTGILLMLGPATAPGMTLMPWFEVTGTAQPAGFQTIGSVDTTAALLEIFRPADFAAVRFFRYARVLARSARPLVSLADNSPAVLAGADGRLIVWTFAADLNHSDIVLRAVFVPLLHRCLTAVAGGNSNRDRLVGETLRVATADPAATTVQTPGGSDIGIVRTAGGQPVIEYARTTTPGIYILAGQPLAVNPDPAEGDLQRFEPAELAQRGWVVTEEIGGGAIDLIPLLLWLAVAAFAAELILLCI